MKLRKESDRKTLLWIYGKTKKRLWYIAVLAVANIVIAALATVFALQCRSVIDSAVAGNFQGLVYSGIILGVISLVQYSLKILIDSVYEVVSARVSMDLRQDIIGNLMKKDFSQTSKYHSGEMLNRIFSDVTVVTDGVVGILPSLLNMVTRLVCAAAVLIILDVTFALVFLVSGILLFIVTRMFRGKLKSLHKEVQQKEGKMRSYMQETVENILLIKLFGVRKKSEKRTAELQQEHFKARMKRRSFTIGANAGIGLVFRIGYLYALIRGAFAIMDRTMSYGTLSAILQLVGQLQAPFANLSGFLPRMYSAIASAERIIEIENLPEEKEPEKKLSYKDFDRLEIKNLSFSYGENHVLNDVSFTLNKKDFLSLTGISGGGKTTLFNLIMGAYKTDKDEIIFYDTKGNSYTPTEARGIIGYVPQGNSLFSGTVFENIGFMKENPTMEEIENAAKIACAHEFIRDFPMGYDTMLGENGFGISQGQAQRIAVARAVLSGTGVLLFDEATSALDEMTQVRMLENLSKLRDKTVIIVTHRKAALAICNRHLNMENGEIYEKES
ncbi:MAG TPA: ABC transporter ATP-binding protein [Candidatus Limousia pullorum]|uniref:ABC transporter ATP-binding protein n=1 Tax=Candidatus Limousia pullorum TaxID=2840860 RepID=A0A9D1S8A5_9FIRM|nr:ABC transporter ATP-binding protein [Candidatus Limousia pullorum]